METARYLLGVWELLLPLSVLRDQNRSLQVCEVLRGVDWLAPHRRPNHSSINSQIGKSIASSIFTLINLEISRAKVHYKFFKTIELVLVSLHISLALTIKPLISTFLCFTSP